MQFDVASVVDPVQCPHGHNRWKRPHVFGRCFETNRFQESLSELSPKVIEVSSSEGWGVPVGVLQDVAIQKPANLNLPFKTSQSQVEIE